MKTSSAVDSFVIRRYMDQCSTLDPSCWQWHTFDVPVAVVEVAPATPFPEGADVALGADAVDRVIVHIGPAGACPERRPLAEEMCADPLGGACTGGAFTCDNGDGGLLCDGGVPGDHDGGAVLDAPAAHDHGDGGGCATAGGKVWCWGDWPQRFGDGTMKPRSLLPVAATGLTEHHEGAFHAPFVAESRFRLGLELAERLDIAINGTILILGKVVLVQVDEAALAADGSIDLVGLEMVASTALDTYFGVSPLARLAHAKPDLPVSRIS